jgi:hypothetical protein
MKPITNLLLLLGYLAILSFCAVSHDPASTIAVIWISFWFVLMACSVNQPAKKRKKTYRSTNYGLDVE